MKTSKRIIATTISAIMILTSLLTVNVFAAKEFTDVPQDYYYKPAIDSLVTKGIIDGVQEADGTFSFRPENTISRAEFAKLVAVSLAKGVTLTEKTAQFSDLAQDHWANTYIAYAVKNGIVNGYVDGTFKPENPVTYGEAVKMLVCAKGYGNQYTPTEPWYQGYVNIANKIELTKNAYALGTNEAKRGMVAQLIYNMDYTKNMAVSGTGGVKLPDYDPTEDYETYDGVVTGIFETTLSGKNLGLNKYQIMIDDEIFHIGDYDLESLYDYLGKRVEIEYLEGVSKTEVKSIELSGKNDTITLDAGDIDRIDGYTIRYYEDDEAEDYEEIDLSDDLYIIYNGYGIDPDEIDEDLVEELFDMENGQIKLLNNGGTKDYDVAFITRYETYFVTSVKADNDIFTVTDSYKGESVEFDKDVTTAYKVSTANGSKQSLTIQSTSSIPKNSVMSIAKPYDREENVQIIISTIKLSNAEVDEMTGYFDPVTINNKEYDVSKYFNDRRSEAVDGFELKVGDVATFYMDYTGDIVCLSKTENSDPYAYILGFDPKGSGASAFSGNPQIKLYAMVGSSARETILELKPTIKFNGSSVDASDVGDLLKETADAINADWEGDEITKSEQYSQLIKYKTSSYNGDTVLSEIYTVDPDDYEDGDITTKAYRKNDDGDKVPYSDGVTTLKCNSSRAFTDANGATPFTTNSSTIVFVVSDDRTDTEKIQKKSNTYFTASKSYVVEPYDVKANVAKVVVVYTDGSAPIVDILNNEPVYFIREVGQGKKNPTDEEYVDKILYYSSNSSAEDKYLYTEELGTVTDDLEGYLVRFAMDGGVVTGVQKLFGDGVFYDFDDDKPLTAFEASGYEIEHMYNGDTDYYRVVYGTVHDMELDANNTGALVVIADVVDDHGEYDPDRNQVNCNVSTSTKVYRWEDDDFELVDASYLDYVEGDGGTNDATEASKVLVIFYASSSTPKAIYIVE